MPRHPETRALIEQALRHLLSEQEKLLKRDDSSKLTEILSCLNRLTIDTSNLLAEGFNWLNSTSALTQEAKRLTN
jgi:hypothetical protein